MSNTYQERVLRYRVFKQLNDTDRNPEGNWTLFYSTNNVVDAEAVAVEQTEHWVKCGDQFKVVDAGEETTITRSAW